MELKSTKQQSENSSQIPKGYKQTELGIIPEDWVIKKFGDLINYLKGFPFQPSIYRSYGTRIIRVSDTDYSSIKEESIVFIDKDLAKKYKRWSLNENDLIFSTVGSKPPMYDSLVGKIILISKKYEGSLLNQNAVLVRSKNNCDITQKFLLNHFRTKRYIKYIEIIFRGNANQASITLNDLFKYKIPVPSKSEEQKAIANVLSDVDALIQSLTSLIEKKRKIKQGTMQNLLTGKKRLPQFDQGQGYKQTEIGLIPEDWKFLPLLDISTKIQDGTHFSPKVNGNDYLYITSKNIKFGYLDILNADHITKVQHKKIYKRCDVKKGDLLLTKDGANTGNAALNTLKEEFSLLSSVAFIRPDKNQCESKYLLQQVLSDLGQKRIKEVMSGNAITRLTLDKIKNLLFPFPLILEEQKAIAEVLSVMDEEIQVLEKKLSKYQQVKQGVMQNLLTGKIRLVEPEKTKSPSEE